MPVTPAVPRAPAAPTAPPVPAAPAVPAVPPPEPPIGAEASSFPGAPALPEASAGSSWPRPLLDTQEAAAIETPSNQRRALGIFISILLRDDDDVVDAADTHSG